MKRKDKYSNQIPVPVGGMSSSHPLKSKLSSQQTADRIQKVIDKCVRIDDLVKLSSKRTSIKNQEIDSRDKSIYKELGNCCDMRKPNKKVINLFKRMPYRDLVKHIREEEVQALKMLYFKGWLLSRE